MTTTNHRHDPAQPTLLDILTTPTTTPSAPTPKWLVNHLVATGHLTETGATRRARIRPCPNCHDLILVALDGDRCAFEAHVDPDPLTALGEALAVIDNRHTWTLRRSGDGYVLDPRDATSIAYRPAGTEPRADILRQHRCHTAPVPAQLAAPTSFAEAHPHTHTDDHPPF